MNNLLSKEIIEEISGELGVNPAFIEKDWYAVKLIKALSEKKFDGFVPVFAGGTSLSKGYNIIQRFSEDLDFKFVEASNLTREQRRNIKNSFIDCIKEISDFKIADDNIKVRNEGKNCCIYVEYPHNPDLPQFLRPFLQVEIFFDDDKLPFELRSIQSFITQYSNNEPDTHINCVKPFNTGADKFNALVWRIYNKDKATDYTLLRHLHDLYAMKSYLEDRQAFKERVLHNFETKDKPRLHDNSVEFKDIVKDTLNLLQTDSIFRKKYEEYVEVMSYASISERIRYDDALSFFTDLSKLFIE